MPRTENPQYSTYKTERIPLVKDVFLRSTNSYDAVYENCIVEVLKNKDTKQFDIAAMKRPGTSTVLASASIASEFRGCFFWERKNALIYVIGNTFWFWTVTTDITTATSSASLTTTTGAVGFVEYQYDDGHVTVVWSDGTKLGEISDTFVVSTSADADLPSPHLPYPVYLDGYVFIVKSGTADIYNSDLNNPLAWTPGNYITAEMSPDNLVRIEKMSNYIMALGSSSIEYFYDAANASGSPLSRNDTFYKQLAYIGGLGKYGNKLLFIGRLSGGNPDIFTIEDVKITSSENQQIKRFLSRVTDFSTINGSVITFDSHTYYQCTIGGATFVWDIDTDFFTNWKHKQYSTFNVKYSDTAYATNGINTFMYLVDDNKLVKFDTSSWQDSTVNFTMTVRTDPLDFDTLQMKFMSRLSLYCDNSNTTASITIKWTDDDYATYSTEYTIALNQELPSIRKLGGFRKRAFVFTNSENQPIRFRGFEVDLNMGNS